MKKFFISSLVVIGVLFSGCGDSEDSSSDNVKEQPSLSSSYNLQDISQDTFDVTLTGTDTDGGNWEGSMSIQERGTDYINGVSYKLIENYVYLMETNSGFSSSGITQSYINSKGLSAYMITDEGVICEMVNNPLSMSTNVKIGDFGEGGDYVCSDGSTSSSNWQLKAENGYAKFIYTTDTRISGTLMYTNTMTITLDESSNATNLNMVVYYPDSGVKLTLDGER